MEDITLPEYSPGREFWKEFKKNKLAVAGLAVLCVLAVVAVLGKTFTEYIVLFNPSTVRLADKFLPPFSHASVDIIPNGDVPLRGIYILGTDELGRDVFARMLQGTFVSISIGFIAVGLSVVVGIFLGGVAGFYGQIRIGIFTVDTLVMRFVDIMLCFPTFFLILTVVALLPPSIYTIMVVIGLTTWMGTARFVRAEFLTLRETDFVVAAKALGIPEYRQIFFHMVPNAIAPVLVSATIGVASAILTESGLSFLGFGVQPPDASWGNILSDGKGFIFDAPWLTFIPGFTILIVVLAFNLCGEGLREAINPQLRKR
jgi:peptide/nickel transport system permease protein